MGIAIGSGVIATIALVLGIIGVVKILKSDASEEIKGNARHAELVNAIRHGSSPEKAVAKIEMEKHASEQMRQTSQSSIPNKE